MVKSVGLFKGVKIDGDILIFTSNTGAFFRTDLINLFTMLKEWEGDDYFFSFSIENGSYVAIIPREMMVAIRLWYFKYLEICYELPFTQIGRG